MTIGGKQRDTLDDLPVSKAFNPKKFLKFCDNLTIDTKENGKQKLKLLGTQRYYLQEIAEGLAAGQHFFVVLKGRQLGISTISLALDLYWEMQNPGLQGSLVTDTDDNRNGFRTILTMYLEGLPLQYKVPIKAHNRYQLVLANTSQLSYLVAGVKKTGSLGTGKAINFLHATECSSWGDEAGLRNLMATLAEHNPKRFYVFESTARGYNLYQEMWETAKDSGLQRAIFIGWWRNEMYRKEKGSPEYALFWDGHIRQEEGVWIKEVEELYDFDIQPEQIAWWRWKLEEEIHDEVTMYQEYPPTEEYAFQMTGSKFFTSMSLKAMREDVKGYTGRFFSYHFGSYIEHTTLHEVMESDAELTIWEPYESGVQYVVGADPAFGASEWADNFCASVWACYADRCIQVAEYCTTNVNTVQFAWVLAHLCGVYEGALLNLEITGPGQAVLNELQNLMKLPPSPDRDEIYNVAANIRHYFYRRIDSLSSGVPALQWYTNAREKERMLNTLRDYFERGMLQVTSLECIDEMKIIVRKDAQIEADGRGKDDRVLAMGLAIIAWNDWLMLELITNRTTYAGHQAGKKLENGMNVLQRMTMNFLAGVGQESDAEKIYHDLG